ncbi:MAG: FkbM family methyltransferase [Thermonemataceae bacterium]
MHTEGIEMQLEGADGGSIFGEGNKVTVESTRLKTWLLQESSIDMLKMDIEGAEVSVLEDCGKALEKVSNLFVEYHAYTKQPQALHKLISILSAAGFRYYVQEAIPRKKPLVNHQYRNQQVMDLQLNIYAYRLK